MAYFIHATAPTAAENKGWDFRPGFFPRKVIYKADAERYKKEAEAKGGTGVTIKKAI